MSSAEKSAPDTSSDERRTPYASLLTAEQLFKYYGPQAALQDVEFRLGRRRDPRSGGRERRWEVDAVEDPCRRRVQPDSGSLTLRGQPLRLRSPREAIEAGMSYIPQELEYLPNLTVADNLLVGRWPNRHGFTNRKLARAEAERLAARFGISLDVWRPITAIALAERQLVEILKALALTRASSSSTSPRRRSPATEQEPVPGRSRSRGRARRGHIHLAPHRRGHRRRAPHPRAAQRNRGCRDRRRGHDTSRGDPGDAQAPSCVGPHRRPPHTARAPARLS